MIVVFCGVPGSGKSTIAQLLRERLSDVSVIVSDDISSHTYQNIMNKLDNSIGDYKHIIVDATFYKEKWRKKIRSVVDDSDEITLVYIQCSRETCLQRNSDREDSIQERAIHIIWNEFDEPEKPEITIKTEEKTPDEMVEAIIERLKEKD